MLNFGVFSVDVKDGERAFLTRNGRIERLLGPGRFRKLDLKGELTAEVVTVTRAEIPAERALMLEKTHPAIAEDNFVIVQTGSNEVAIVSFDGEPFHIVRPNVTRAFWKTLTQVDIERVDTAATRMVPERIVDKLADFQKTLFQKVIVEAHETGLLFVNGALVEKLTPGRYAFWEVGRKVEVKKVDLRPTPLEVTAQEILTKDRVGIRVTLTAFYKVVDAEKAALASGDLAGTLYRMVQFAIREAVATRTLDDILAARDTIDGEVRQFVAKRAADLGIEVGEIGVKDVILPGDVRDLLNKVVEAERVAKANLIRRQEETAATRSLLNTARLMEDNPLLLRLKELEALEKLVEKVGRIDLHTGEMGGFDAMLQRLYKLGGQTAGETGNGAR